MLLNNSKFEESLLLKFISILILVYSLHIAMSKIWKNPITLPDGVQVVVEASTVTVKWPKWVLSFPISDGLSVSLDQNILQVTCNDENLWNIWGTTRAILSHMIHGVHTGYTKALQVIGVGFDAVVQGTDIQFKLGFSHPVRFPIPQGVEVKIEKDPKGNAIITLSSHDKQLIGQTASRIRDLKRPEPYKGKGIRYVGEVIKLKAGKAAKK